VTAPRKGDPVQFATQIKPLFRPKDVQSMRRHFDLGSYQDVTWPPQQVEVFERWVRGGKLA